MLARFEKLYEARLTYFFVTTVIVYSISIGFDSNAINGLPELVRSHGHYFLIGLVAAIVANTTGAGGGIVFFPAFMSMGIQPQNALATSIAIQCFGMTAGTFAWQRVRKRELQRHDMELNESMGMPVNARHWQHFPQILALSASGCLIGLIVTQHFYHQPPFSVHWFFSIFSIMVGVALLLRNTMSQKLKLEALDWNALTVFPKKAKIAIFSTCLAGGAITAWISIGVGEMLAVLLILIGIKTSVAIASAVTISAFAVITAIPFHIFSTGWIDTHILLFAAPAAAIGGSVSGYVATLLGAERLKLFVAAWIIFSGVVFLIV